jgi:P2-related tail formation protein
MEKGNNVLLPSNVEDYFKLMAMIFVQPPKIPASFRKIMIPKIVGTVLNAVNHSVEGKKDRKNELKR